MLELYANIKKLREARGMSQDELAKEVGFKSRSSINKIELGINDITQSKLVAIAKALHVTPADLLGENNMTDYTASAKARKIMSKNLHYYLNRSNTDINTFCEDLGIDVGVFDSWLMGRTYPNPDMIVRMADHLGVPYIRLKDKYAADIEKIFDDARDTYENIKAYDVTQVYSTYKTKQRKIPLLGKVAAGVPIYADDHVEGHEFIDSKYRDDGFEYFALRVSGHSMEPTIQDGDIVVVRQQDTVDSGQIAIVLVDGEDATAKEVRLDKSGITLVGHNISVYTPKFYTNEQIADLPVKIIGLVIEVRHKLI